MKYLGIVFLSTLLLSLVIGVLSLIYYLDLHLKFLIGLSVFNLVIFAICLIILLILVSRRGIRNLIKLHSLYWRIERNLIHIGAYTENGDKIVLPKVKVSLESSKVIIKLNSVKVRKVIESYADEFSSALTDDLAVSTYYLNNSGSEFIIEFKDENNYVQTSYSLDSYLAHIDTLPKYSFEVDDNHLVNLIDYPHWAVLGSTGSGKSYLSQMILLQFIRKGFEVSVLDLKNSYGAFKNYVYEYETEPKAILDSIERLSLEMRNRQITLSSYLEKNPRALAIDCGYKQKVIFIEEYIGLKSVLDKEENKKLDNLIKQISVLARSQNISLFLIAQSSSVDLIEASIKNNLNKIFMGRLASNIQVSTFGNGVDVPLFNHLEKGYGYIQLDNIEQIKVPKLEYEIKELNNLYFNLF